MDITQDLEMLALTKGTVIKAAGSIKRGDRVELDNGSFATVTREVSRGFWAGSVFLHFGDDWSCVDANTTLNVAA